MENKKQFDWVTAPFLIILHTFTVMWLVYIYAFTSYRPSAAIWTAAVILFIMSGMSITGGYHRLFAHPSYKANPLIEMFYLFFGGIAIEQSALKWSDQHRDHHAYVDTDKDPYNINEGFWYAHMKWMFYKQKPINKKTVNDLFQNKRVMFQHKFYALFAFGGNALVAYALGKFFNDFVGAVLIITLVRIVFLHHCTWFINSLAHTWGSQAYSNAHSPMDNVFISFLTFGEGYHNYHHTFGNDYRNGPLWYNFDPTKWLIWTLSKVGLARDLRRAAPVSVQKHTLEEEKGVILYRLRNLHESKKKEIEAQLEKLSQNIIKQTEKLSKFYNENKAALKEKSAKLCSEKKEEFKTLKEGLKQELSEWKRYRKEVVSSAS